MTVDRLAHAALLIVDMQNDFVRVGAPLEVPQARETITVHRELIAFCRERDIPVLYTKFVAGPGRTLIWEWSPVLAPPICCCWKEHLRYYDDVGKELDGSDIISEIYPEPADPIVEKFGYGSFHNTNLDDFLTAPHGGDPSHLELLPANGVVGGKLGRGAFEHDAPVAHHVDAMGDLQRDGQLLLDEQDRHAPSRDLAQEPPDLHHKHGRQSLRRLVDDDEIRIAHERPAHGQHLLLAAREDARRVVLSFLERRKQGEQVVEGPSTKRVRALEAELQILSEGQRGKDLPILRNIADAGAGDEICPQARDVTALEEDLPLRRHEPHDGLAGGAAPDPVSAEQADDLAVAHREADTVQDVALPVEGVEFAHREHQDAPVPSYAPCTARFARMAAGTSEAIT